MMRAAAALAAVLDLAACADGCDPNQAGFFGGVRNIATGCYERDTATLRTGAAQSEQQAQALDADNAHIQMELGRLDTQERQLRERQQRLNRQLAGQLRQLDTAKAQKASSQAQLTALRQRADAFRAAEQGRLNAEPAGQVSSPELDRLEQQNKALQRDIDELLGTVGAQPWRRAAPTKCGTSRPSASPTRRPSGPVLRGRPRVPDTQDGLPAGPELAGQGGHGRSFLQPPRTSCAGPP